MNKKKNIICIIARTNSTRLPKKVLKKINDKTMIENLIDRIKLSYKNDGIYLCTSTHPDDTILADLAKKNNIKSYAGSELSVIDRMLDVAKKENADNLIRITGDNPLVDPYILDDMIDSHIKEDADYTIMEFLPRGVSAEVISVRALKDLYKKMDPNESQYLTLYINKPEDYRCNYLIPEEKIYKPFLTFSVDEKFEFESVKFLIEKLGIEKPIVEYINLAEKTNICKIAKNFPVKLSETETISYKKFLNWKENRIQYAKRQL